MKSRPADRLPHDLMFTSFIGLKITKTGFNDYFPCSPGFQFGPRIIHEHQFIYVIKGKGKAVIQNREYEAEAGNLLWAECSALL